MNVLSLVPYNSDSITENRGIHSPAALFIVYTHIKKCRQQTACYHPVFNAFSDFSSNTTNPRKTRQRFPDIRQSGRSTGSPPLSASLINDRSLQQQFQGEAATTAYAPVKMKNTVFAAIYFSPTNGSTIIPYNSLLYVIIVETYCKISNQVFV